MRRLLVAAVLALSSSVASAQSQTLTFDDLGQGPIRDGYGGFHWSNVVVAQQSRDNNVAWAITIGSEQGSFCSDDPFTLLSADVGHIFGTGNITFTGYTNGGTVSRTFSAGAESAHVDFNWTGLNQVVVTASGPVYHVPLIGSVDTDVSTSIDNLTYSRGGNSYGAPEPATFAMTLAGLGLVGWAARRRSAKSKA